MTPDLFYRYLHFVSIFVLVSAVFGQHFLLKKTTVRSDIVRVQRLDVLYLIAVFVVLGTGFLQWFAGSKGEEFYSKNWILHLKTGVFILVGILSAYPSVFFGKHKKGDPTDVVAVPAAVIWCVRLELLLLFTMPFLANLMARGIGLKP